MYTEGKSVVLLESNVQLLEELKKAIEESGLFRAVHVGDDGSEGLRALTREKPDVAIIGTFLKGKDGCSVIREAKAIGLDCKIVATGVAGESIISRVMNEGADYYLIKPFSIKSAISLMEELCAESAKAEKNEQSAAMSEEPRSFAKKRKGESIEEKISDIFISIGIPPHIKGYGYLREGIKRTVKRPELINSVTKELYPSVAKAYGTTASKVERAIRHAIEVAWNRGRIDAINAVFGTRVYLGNEKPTNSEFIALVADKLILESLA